MDKLIELLNEYEKIAPSRLQRKYYSESGYIMYIDEEGEDVDDYRTDYEIISKYYGFIKRLVDNDKIKYNKVPEHIYVSDYSFETIHKGMTDNILMWLAIQDEPIEFLISILK